MEGHKKISIGFLLIISLAANIFYYTQFKEANERIDRANGIIASNVERNLRQSIRHIEDLIETESQEAMRNIEQATGALALSFQHWVDLNQSEKRPNERMETGLNSIEMMRNTLSHNLKNQYTKNDYKLIEYDIEMLEKVNQQLNRLLLTYHQIEDRLHELKNPLLDDSGLVSIAMNLEEISRLYRHSQKPNEHPDYITHEEAMIRAKEVFGHKLENLKLEEENPSVTLREGVHYYALNYAVGEENLYTIWIDAIDGSVRNFEMRREEEEKEEGLLNEAEAITIARRFVRDFYKGKLKEEMFYVEQNGSGSGIYSFRFIPIREDIEVVSDVFTVNLAANSGEILKFSNDFHDTEVVHHKRINKIEELMENYLEEFGEMQYEGEAIVRSFFTRYQPRLTYVYRTVQNQQEVKVFMDVTSGVPVYQLYDIYEPIVN